jgi:hypothetical protein
MGIKYSHYGKVNLVRGAINIFRAILAMDTIETSIEKGIFIHFAFSGFTCKKLTNG